MEWTTTTRRAACCAALLALPVIAQMAPPALTVNGRPVAAALPPRRMNGEWSIPLQAVAQALGARVRISPQEQTFRVLRADGSEALLAGRTGEIRSGFLLVGLSEPVPLAEFSLPDAAFTLPLSTVVTLLGVTAEMDDALNRLDIRESPQSPGGPGADGPRRAWEIAALDYNYGLTTNGRQFGQFTHLLGDALAGNVRILGGMMLNRVPGHGFIRFAQGFGRFELPRQRVLVLGDQGVGVGIEPLQNGVRGGSFQMPWRKFTAQLYAGRAVGETTGTLSSGLPVHDTTVAGLTLSRGRPDRTMQATLGANIFHGRERRGRTAGGAWSWNSTRNLFHGEALAGHFAGLSSRATLPERLPGELAPPLSEQLLTSGAGPDWPAQPVAEPPRGEVVRVPVRGLAAGYSLSDTVIPLRQVSLTGRWDWYTKNFLTARDDSRFSAVNARTVSVNLFPISYFTLSGALNDRSFRAGAPSRSEGYSYGGGARLPGPLPLQVNYLRSVQLDAASPLGRFELRQYTAMIPRFGRFALHSTYASVFLAGKQSDNLATRLSVGMGRLGTLTLQDQRQWGNSHLIGAAWDLRIGNAGSYIRFAVDQLKVSSGRGAVLPAVALRVPLAEGHHLEASYIADRGTHTVQLTLGGSLMRRRELARAADGQAQLVVRADLTGRVYVDEQQNGVYDPGTDRPLPAVRVWLSSSQSAAVTDAQGVFQFERLVPGAYTVRADLSGIPAGLVFAAGDSVSIPVLPYQVNVVDIRVIRSGQISGSVHFLDYSGDPDAPVERPLIDARVELSGGRDALSESNGSYVLGDLPPGRYLITVDPATLPRGYQLEASRLEVQVRPGETVRGVRFRAIIPRKPVLERRLD